MYVNGPKIMRLNVEIKLKKEKKKVKNNHVSF